MKDEAKYVAECDESGEALVGTLKDIRIWLNENDMPLTAASVYRLGSKVNLVLAVEDM